MNEASLRKSSGFRLHHLDWLGSVWKISTVNPFVQFFDVKTGKYTERHIAPYPVELPHRLIVLFSKLGDYVLDPFCGSGTTNLAALSLQRKTIGYDLEQKYIDMAKKRCGGRGIFHCKSCEDMKEVYTNSIQLCVTSPPYLNLRQYSDKTENIGNMTDPYPALKKVFTEVYRILKPRGIFCLNVAGAPDGKGYSHTFPFDMIYLCKELGFKLKNAIIWDKGIILKEWNIYNTKMYENHEYVWVMEK